MADTLDRVRLLARDCDMKLGVSGSKLVLTYDEHAIFEGTPEETLLYLRGWHDGRDHYIRYESRGASE